MTAHVYTCAVMLERLLLLFGYLLFSFSIQQDETDKVQFQALSQSVKAICNILSKIETIDVAKSLQRVESILNQLKNSVATNAQASTLPPEHSGGGYATLQRRR